MLTNNVHWFNRFQTFLRAPLEWCSPCSNVHVVCRSGGRGVGEAPLQFVAKRDDELARGVCRALIQAERA